MEKTWYMSAIRSFFSILDRFVYWLISVVYDIILDLSSANIINSNVIEDLYSRAYTLLGIFMLFKLTFSFVNYVINPDSFTDKTKGVQNLAKNVIIVLVLIIMVPFAFAKLYEVQDAIISDNLIPRFIMGISDTNEDGINNNFQMDSDCGSSSGYAKNGNFMALATFRPFFHLEDGVSIPPGYCSTSADLSINTYMNSKIYNATSQGVYIVDYGFFISTIVGIVVLLLLITFCFDVAVRTIKLVFLQMIAPVPIMSYIDPASGKNGMFSKWLKQIGSTWTSLFIRLFALFFAIYMVDIISNSSIISQLKHPVWSTLFLIIGALIFAKQLPKLIEELIPGLKLGGLKLNPFKKVADDAFLGKQALGGTAAIAGLGLGAASWAGSTLHNWDKNKVDNLEKKKDLAIKRYGEGSVKAQDAEAAWEDAKLKLDNKKKAREARIDNIKGTLHIDEIALHPVTNTMKELTRGLRQMKDAAGVAYKQGSSQKFSAVGVGKESSNIRDYKDKYNMWNRAKDKATDFMGVKNESGTTSKVKEDIKAQDNLIATLQENLRMMNTTFSDLYTRIGAHNAAQILEMDSKTGLYSIKDGVDSTFAGRLGINSNDFNSMTAILSQIKEATEATHAAQKERNRLQKVQDSKPGSKAA